MFVIIKFINTFWTKTVVLLFICDPDWNHCWTRQLLLEQGTWNMSFPALTMQYCEIRIFKLGIILMVVML